MVTRYKPYPEPFLSDIMLGPMAGVVADYGNQIKARAQAIAPTDVGDYKASLDVTIDSSRRFRWGPRAIAIVSAGGSHAPAVEARHHVMQRAKGG